MNAKEESVLYKRSVSPESFVFLGSLAALFILLGMRMGGTNLINTLIKTAYDILMSTVFYIMAIAVIMGALSELLSEFGVVALIHKVLSPLIKPIYGLPGASALGIVSTYLSDNPAILTLAESKNFRKYFAPYQVPALTNLGTAFGMGLIVTTFVISISAPAGENLFLAALIGNLGAVIGSIVSTRIMLVFTKKAIGRQDDHQTEGQGFTEQGFAEPLTDMRRVRHGSAASRFLEAALDGGKSGVTMGMTIIPGVLIICTFVLLLTNGAPSGGYTGGAYEGIGLLPMLGGKIQFIIKPLFGFQDPQCLAVPITALGAAGAAMTLIPKLLATGAAHAGDVAVFTAMCMCWSGYLSTHVAMMEALGYRRLTGKAIFSHTIGGLAAGISANFMFRLFTLAAG
ncbi:membrane protein [Spirochaetia bacterium]|nr:membrane protein [Spirochaetia bacterium]